VQKISYFICIAKSFHARIVPLKTHLMCREENK
jgi:hypothetical protein